MPELPAALKNCSSGKCVAALLYLGWTHEEIAAATNVSKGTVQNRRIELEGGNLYPPPEAFDLIRPRERDVHRIARDSENSPDAVGTVIADRLEAIADLDVLDIGPDGAISYEQLVAFATLIAGQVDDANPQEVVKQLAPVALLVTHSSRLSEPVVDSARLSRPVSSALCEDAAEVNHQPDDGLDNVNPSAGNFRKRSSPRAETEDNNDMESWCLEKPAWFSAKPDVPGRNQQFDSQSPDERAVQSVVTSSENKESGDLFRDNNECQHCGRSHEKGVRVCWFATRSQADDRTDSLRGTSPSEP